MKEEIRFVVGICYNSWFTNVGPSCSLKTNISMGGRTENLWQFYEWHFMSGI
jgi:hypothetical protein